MNAYDRLMLEAIPHGFPPPVDTSDGPTACLMRVERQRALWVMAHDGDGVDSHPQTVDGTVSIGVTRDHRNMSNHNESAAC